MKKMFLLLLVCFMQSAFCIAQINLVPNPSFEQQSSCPNDESQIWKAIDWKNFGWSPDYFSACDTTNVVGVPLNEPGFQYAASGVSYAGLYTYQNIVPNGREYIGVQLISPLNKGIKYFMSMKVSPAFTPPNISGFDAFTNNLGFVFTNYEVDSNSTQAIGRYHVIDTTIISDTINWTVIKGSFVADSNYIYLVIGNLLDDAHTLIDSSIVDTFHIFPRGAYYYIDNVCVSTDSVYAYNYVWTGINEMNYNESKIEIYPNPASEYFKVKSYNNVFDQIELINNTGKILKTYTPSSVYMVSELEQGIYFVKFYYNNKKYIYKKLIIINK